MSIQKDIDEFEGAVREFAVVLSGVYGRRKDLVVLREVLPTSIEDYIQQLIQSVEEGSWDRLIEAAFDSLKWDSYQVERAFERVSRGVDSSVRERLEQVSSAVGWLFLRLYRFYDEARRAIFAEKRPQELVGPMREYLREATSVIRRETTEIQSLLDAA